MAQRTKYRLPKRGGNSYPLWITVLTLVLAGLIGWVWWHEGQAWRVASARPSPGPTARPTPPRPSPAAPAARTPSSNPMIPVPVPPAPPPPRTNAPAPATDPVVLTPPPGPIATPAAPAATNTAVPPPVALPAPPPPTNTFPRPVQGWFEAQIVLDRLGFSPGSIDGAPGNQSHSALRAFQGANGLRVTGDLDDATRAALLLSAAPLTAYRITAQDLARLQPVSKTWLGKSRQSGLEFETILELLAERSHSHPRFVSSLNPGLNWHGLEAGAVVTLPEAIRAPPATKAAAVLISLGERTLEALDAKGHVVAHFPCSIAQRVDKRPVGDLHVVVMIRHPTYTFNPEIFPESAEARRLGTKLILPPGPNNPVGLVWIGLDKPGYGIHGTPSPEQVGRTESHGCFRLANWNATNLFSLAWVGMPVRVVR